MAVTDPHADTVAAPPSGSRTLLALWLYAVAATVVAIVLVGGATRLTDSGLSITEWQPIHGVIPPLNAEQWEEEFAKYRQIPEFRLQNFDMDLAAFKVIFWWEWAHRFLGRLAGVVLVVPALAFWATGRLDRVLVRPVATIFVLGLTQGAIGWWMVTSGLVDRVDVSQYRLAVHLTLAFVILAYVVWTAAGLSRGEAIAAPGGHRHAAIAVLVLAFVQVFSGGLVAGLDAGLTFNTWPLMDGGLVAGAVFDHAPWWRAPFESVAAVQFQHRLIAYLLLAAGLLYAWAARRTAARRGAALLAAAILAQAVVGIATLVLVVPLPLALLHQLGAALVVATAAAHLRRFYPPLALAGGRRAAR